MSEYPVVKNAYGFKVICNRILFNEATGMSWNWSGGIKIPNTADIKGILNFFLYKGIGVSRMTPFAIATWGIVGEITG